VAIIILLISGAWAHMSQKLSKNALKHNSKCPIKCRSKEIMSLIYDQILMVGTRHAREREKTT